MLHRPIETTPFIRWDEKAGLRRDAIRSQRLTRSRRNGKPRPVIPSYSLRPWVAFAFERGAPGAINITLFMILPRNSEAEFHLSQ